MGALTVGNIASARIAAEAAGLTPKFTILHFPSDMAQDYVTGDDIKVVQINRKAASPEGIIRVGETSSDLNTARPFASCPVTTR